MKSREPKISNSRAKNKICPICLSKDVRGMPSPLYGKKYHSFMCATCNHRYTQGHRGWINGFFKN